MATSPSIVTRCGLALLCAGVVFLGGCSGIGHLFLTWQASRFDGEISRAGQAIAAAGSDTQRAAAYANRADAYSEKARYSRLQKLIPIEEYSRLFDLALQDYNHAIALAPANPDMYFRRGNAYYSRAGLDMIYAPYKSDFLAPAKADFSVTVEKNPKNALALDMLGLTDGSMGDWTQAIADFQQEAALDPRQNFRVSDAYCNRGSRYSADKFAMAIADLNRAIEIRADSDACECEPYNPLVAIYLNQTHEYDKAREVVALAQGSKRWIAPEYLEQLKTSSASR